MPATIVRCSVPRCGEAAESKVAAPWKGGSFSELKTYGYTCGQHFAEMIEYAKNRPKPTRLPPGESVGEIGTYTLAGR
jgi:hypothetical protein